MMKDEIKYDEEYNDDFTEPTYADLLDAQEDVLGEEQARQQFNYTLEYGPLFNHLNATADAPLLTVEEEIELGKKIKYGNPRERKVAIDELVLKNMRLVVYNAKKCKFPKTDLDDLIQEGLIGLIRAAGKFDYEKQFRFATYATYWINQAINRKGHDMSKTIRVPSHMIIKKNKVNKALKSLEEKGISSPSYEQIVEECGGKLTYVQVKSVMEDTDDAVSLDISVNNSEEGTSLLNFIDFGVGDGVQEAMDKQYKDKFLVMLMENLTPRERIIVTMKNGLFGEVEMTVRQLSEVYGITKERIRQINGSAIKKMTKKYKQIKTEFDFELDDFAL